LYSRFNNPGIVVVGMDMPLQTIFLIKKFPVQVVLTAKNNYHKFLPGLYQFAVCVIVAGNIAIHDRRSTYAANTKKYINIIHESVML
jgi:hypothetical protein